MYTDLADEIIESRYVDATKRDLIRFTDQLLDKLERLHVNNGKNCPVPNHLQKEIKLLAENCGWTDKVPKNMMECLSLVFRCQDSLFGNSQSEDEEYKDFK